MVLYRILLGASRQILTPEGDREPDVKHDADYQADPDDPKKLASTLQEGRISIHRIGTRKDG
jgi:hypothetical protein